MRNNMNASAFCDLWAQVMFESCQNCTSCRWVQYENFQNITSDHKSWNVWAGSFLQVHSVMLITTIFPQICDTLQTFLTQRNNKFYSHTVHFTSIFHNSKSFTVLPLNSLCVRCQLYSVKNIGTQDLQELFFFCEVSEIGAFMELFTIKIWLIWQVFLVAMYSKKETGNLWCTYDVTSVMVR